MIKALMVPIRPEHALHILNGKKTLDLRTWIPKDYVGWVYVYVTKGKPYLVDFREESMMEQKYELFHNKKNVLGILKNKVVNGLVVFRFWFDEYFTYHHYNHGVGLYNDVAEYNVMYDDLEKLCLDYREIENYGKGKELYAWHIKKLEIFDEPKKLSDFYKRIDGLDENGRFMLSSLKDGETVTIPELKKKYLLSKAPRKMVWVYTKENEK